MKTGNIRPDHAIAKVAGRVAGNRAGSPGIRVYDTGSGDIAPAPEIQFVGAQVTGTDGEVAIVTVAATGFPATNAAAVTLNYGDVVVLTTSGTVTTTTTAQDTRPVGVVQIGAAVGQPVQVVFSGYVAQINTTASVTGGNYAETSTTAGKSTENATIRAGSFGRYLGTGSNPAALLFGYTSLSGSSGGGGVPGWFNVKDYGAIGNGATDDRAAINLAIAALNTAGSGVLYFPASATSYIVAGSLTAITAKATVLGDGRYGQSIIESTSTTATLFTVSVDGVAFRDLWLKNATTTSAGAAIVSTTSLLTEFHSITVTGFYTSIDIEGGLAWTMHACHLSDFRKYGVRIRNTAVPDSGDWAISDSWFGSTFASDAAIRLESAGGGKITNVKINGSGGGGPRPNYGIDLAVGTGVVTSVLLIANTSIENVAIDGIRLTATGAGTYGLIAITGCQFGLYSNNAGRIVNASGSGITSLLIDNCLATTDGTARAAIALTNVAGAYIGEVGLASGFNAVYTNSGVTGFLDNTGAIAAGVRITGTPSLGQVPVASSGTAAAWGAVAGGVTAFAAPALTLGTANTAGAATTVLATDSTIAAFDVTVPVTQAFSDAAATGSAAVAARRDHKHGMPATPATSSAHILLADGHATPFTFNDLLQMDDGSDFMWSDS